jgi:hypothetical protein
MQRVLRCDGIVPQYQLDGRDGGPTDVRELRVWLSQHGARPGLDVIAQGETPGDTGAASAVVRPWKNAGCTWWLETRWEMPHHVSERSRQVRDRLAAGPPGLVS